MGQPSCASAFVGSYHQPCLVTLFGFEVREPWDSCDQEAGYGMSLQALACSWWFCYSQTWILMVSIGEGHGSHPTMLFDTAWSSSGSAWSRYVSTVRVGAICFLNSRYAAKTSQL